MLLYATAVFLLLWTDAIFMTSARMFIFILVYMCSILSYFAYATFFVGQYGATPGKLVLGLKVVDVDGCKVGLYQGLGSMPVRDRQCHTLCLRIYHCRL